MNTPVELLKTAPNGIFDAENTRESLLGSVAERPNTSWLFSFTERSPITESTGELLDAETPEINNNEITARNNNVLNEIM